MNYCLKINLLWFITVNLQKLAIEIFKVKLAIAPEIKKNVFPIIKNPCDLRKEAKFKSRNANTVRYGIETASFVAPRIRSSIPRSYKECSSVNEFKAKIKCWYPENCPCKLCKNYIYQIGYTRNMLPVIYWCFCYLRELIQRPKSGTQSAFKYLLMRGRLL